MRSEIYKTEDDYLDYCPCAVIILKYVDSIKDTDVRWFFNVCYSDYPTRSDEQEQHTVIFKSYATPEYKDYVLSVSATKKDGGYRLKLVKKVDNLLTDI